MRQRGFTLTELLVSLLLASIILLSLSQMYLSMKKAYNRIEKQLENQLEVQWVKDLLGHSIRSAGFTPCLSVDQLQVIDRRQGNRHLRGLIIEEAPQQAIQVNKMSPNFATLLAVQSPTRILVAADAPLKGAVLIADCNQGEVQEITTVEKTPQGYILSFDKPLLFTYEATSFVGEWLQERWYIHNNSRAKPSLYYQSNQTEELSSLIHSLSIKSQYTQGNRLLRLSLGLDEQKTEELVIFIRGPA